MTIHEKLKPGRACTPAPFRPEKLRTHSPRIHTFLCVVKRLVPTKNNSGRSLLLICTVSEGKSQTNVVRSVGEALLARGTAGHERGWLVNLLLERPPKLSLSHLFWGTVSDFVAVVFLLGPWSARNTLQLTEFSFTSSGTTDGFETYDFDVFTNRILIYGAFSSETDTISISEVTDD